MTSKRRKRPITVALNIVKRMKPWNRWDGTDANTVRFVTLRSHRRLLAILTEINAASGTTDVRSAARRAKTIRRRTKAKR